MTAIQNIQTPTVHAPALHISTSLIRKAAVTLLALAGVALLVLTVAAAPGVSYFAVLVASIVGIALLGVREVHEEAQKPQFDIR
jgi:hypothetical protein